MPEVSTMVVQSLLRLRAVRETLPIASVLTQALEQREILI